MRILTMAVTEDVFEELAEIYEDTRTIISFEDILSEAESHEPADNQYAVAFFAALYVLTATALSRRDDVLLDCSRITEEERAKLIRALNNTSGLAMAMRNSGREGVILYESK